MGKSTISMAIFNSYVSHYQRVCVELRAVNHWMFRGCYVARCGKPLSPLSDAHLKNMSILPRGVKNRWLEYAKHCWIKWKVHIYSYYIYIYTPLIPVWLQTHQVKLETRFSDTLHLLIPKRVMQTKGPSEQPVGFGQVFFPSLVNIHQISKWM